MTMNWGFGSDAELNYRHERLREDFRPTHGTDKPRGWQLRWWQRRPAAASAAGHRTRTAVGIQHGAKTVTTSTAKVAAVAVQPSAVRGRTVAAGSTDGRAHAA